MRIGSVLLSCVFSVMFLSTASAWEYEVQIRQNAPYTYGSHELDDGFETRLVASLPLSEAERYGSGSLGSGSGFGSGSGTPAGMISPPRLEISLGLESVMDDFGSEGGYDTVKVPNGQGGYDYIQVPNGNAPTKVDLDLYRTRGTVGLGWTADLGGVAGSPPPKNDTAARGYGAIRFGVAAGLSFYSLEYGNEDDTAFGVDLEGYLQYDYPLTEKLDLGLRVDARLPLNDPELGNADLEADDTIQLGYGLIINYSF